MQVEPKAPRFQVEATAGGLRAAIPVKRNWFTLLFLGAWLGGWAFGELNAARLLLRMDDMMAAGFLIFWLVAWTVGGVYAAGVFLWQLVGRETITVNSSTLTHRVEAFGLGHSRTYRASDVKRLRVTEFSTNPFNNRSASLPPITASGLGPVAFDYGARTVRMAPSLEGGEAVQLVRELSVWLPRTVGET